MADLSKDKPLSAGDTILESAKRDESARWGDFEFYTEYFTVTPDRFVYHDQVLDIHWLAWNIFWVDTQDLEWSVQGDFKRYFVFTPQKTYVSFPVRGNRIPLPSVDSEEYAEENSERDEKKGDVGCSLRIEEEDRVIQIADRHVIWKKGVREKRWKVADGCFKAVNKEKNYNAYFLLLRTDAEEEVPLMYSMVRNMREDGYYTSDRFQGEPMEMLAESCGYIRTLEIGVTWLYLSETKASWRAFRCMTPLPSAVRVVPSGDKVGNICGSFRLQDEEGTKVSVITRKETVVLVYDKDITGKRPKHTYGKYLRRKNRRTFCLVERNQDRYGYRREIWIHTEKDVYCRYLCFSGEGTYFIPIQAWEIMLKKQLVPHSQGLLTKAATKPSHPSS